MVKKCQFCGVPKTSETRVHNGMCHLCRLLLRRLVRAEDRALFWPVVRTFWERQGISFEPPVPASPNEVVAKVLDVPESDDPWMELLASWLVTDKPELVYLDDALAAVGLSKETALPMQRERVKTILCELKHPPQRKRFKGAPPWVQSVKVVIPKVADLGHFSVQEVLGLLGRPRDRRNEIYVGRCLQYLGYEKHRLRADDGDREYVYCKKEGVSALPP